MSRLNVAGEVLCPLKQAKPHHIISYLYSVLNSFAVISWCMPVAEYQARLCGVNRSTYPWFLRDFLCGPGTTFWNILEAWLSINPLSLFKLLIRRQISLTSSPSGQYRVLFWLVQSSNWNMLLCSVLLQLFSRRQEFCGTNILVPYGFCCVLRPEFKWNAIYTSRCSFRDQIRQSV